MTGEPYAGKIDVFLNKEINKINQSFTETTITSTSSTLVIKKQLPTHTSSTQSSPTDKKQKISPLL